MLTRQIAKVCQPRVWAALPIRGYTKALSKDTLSSNVLEAQYAVRGAIPQRGEAINVEIKQGKTFPFPQTTPCNIGNP